MSETRRIEELLKQHYDAKEGWATFVELRNGTGSNSTTGIDLFALHTWPSQKYRSIAHEIKISRSDFAKEIKSPLKRAFAEQVSHECLFVVPRGLVQVDEIPEGWGLMVADAGGLKTLKHGLQRSDVQWSKTFMAAIARRCADDPPKLPDVAWKVEGKEIGEDELLAIAAAMLKTTVEREVDRQRDEIRREIFKGEEYRTLKDLEYAVATTMGKYGRITPDDFRQWLTTVQRAAPYDIRQINVAISILQKLVGAKEQERL